MIAPVSQLRSGGGCLCGRLELADILRAHGPAYGRTHPLSPRQATVVRHLIQCRTAALGGHVDACDHCGYTRVSYNSCRDRHCPKCQATRREQWIEARLQRLLPVPHFHVVFTLPEELNPLALRNQAAVYNLLFEAASRTLLQLAKDHHRLGGQLGFTAILHTWGQNLLFHPHLHCVVTGGGLSPDGAHWIAARQNYLLPVQVIGKLFRGKFLHGLQQLYKAGALAFAGSTAELSQPPRWAALRNQLYRKPWIIYAKPPFGGAEQVFRYLGRYSHRVAISNRRLLAMDEQHVQFRYKDYADDHRWKVMQLSAEEFIRRFLLHVLPHRFVRIRHYGLMAGRNADSKLGRARQLLGANNAAQAPRPKAPEEPKAWPQRVLEWTGQDPLRCPHCQQPLTRQVLMMQIDGPGPWSNPFRLPRLDSS